MLKTTCTVLHKESINFFSKACSLATVGVTPGTKVTILNRKRTYHNIFIYETVFAGLHRNEIIFFHECEN